MPQAIVASSAHPQQTTDRDESTVDYSSESSASINKISKRVLQYYSWVDTGSLEPRRLGVQNGWAKKNKLYFFNIVNKQHKQFEISSGCRAKWNLPAKKNIYSSKAISSLFLDASSHLYKSVCPSVGPSVTLLLKMQEKASSAQFYHFLSMH